MTTDFSYYGVRVPLFTKLQLNQWQKPKPPVLQFTNITLPPKTKQSQTSEHNTPAFMCLSDPQRNWNRLSSRSPRVTRVWLEKKKSGISTEFEAQNIQSGWQKAPCNQFDGIFPLVDCSLVEHLEVHPAAHANLLTSFASLDAQIERQTNPGEKPQPL